MTIFERLKQWEEAGVLPSDQAARLQGLVRNEPCSIFLELNVLLYAGIVVLVGGLGWTISTWPQAWADVAALAGMTTVFAACVWYCLRRAPPWSRKQVPAPSLVFDYVLYLGCLVWSAELAYVEARFGLLSGQWDWYLLLTSGLFFLLAYRFDNRMVLSLALSALAGWFGLRISRFPSRYDAAYREYGIIYSLLIGAAGGILARRDVKAHFQGVYLNIAANVMFWAILSGIVAPDGRMTWLLPLLAACGASLAWGLKRRQFPFVAYGAVYGYIGVSIVLLDDVHDSTAVLAYFVITGIAMVAALVTVARRFGRVE